MATTPGDPLKSFYRASVPEDLPDGTGERIRPALLCVDLQGLDASREKGLFADLASEEQRYYFDALESLVIPNVQRLQRAFRVAGHEVVHVRIQSLTLDGRDRSLSHKRLGILAAPGSPEARFLPAVAPRRDEIVVNKTTSGAFDSTCLDAVLRNVGVNALVIVGVYTNECVSTAARVASDLGYYVTVVEDACATVTPALHDHAIASLRDRYARIVDTERAAKEIEASAPPPGASDARARDVPPRTVVLLGGGALAARDRELTMAAQFERAEQALEGLLPVLERGREVLLSHGNGPQVGHMLARVEASLGEAYPLPLEVCVAESEGELGYVLQQSLHNVLRRHRIDRPVASIVTQTIVLAEDPAFDAPSKPIGPMLGEDAARDLRARDVAIREESGGGFRRVVPSPEPRDIVEVDVVQDLLRSGVVALAAGGGGIPVVRREDGSLDGVEAVVDKDLSGALLATAIGAEEMVVLTSVPCVYRDFESGSRERIERATAAECQTLAEEGHFEAGTMAPKAEAARRFALHGGETLICDIDSLADALEGRAGTRIVPD